MSKTDSFRIAFLVSIVFLAGCNTQAKWTYPIDPGALYRTTAARSDLVIGVLPFREARPSANNAATMFLYLIPLMPYGYVNYERPEAAKTFNTIVEYEFQMDEDLGKAAARSLESSGLFRRAYFTLGGETREADYILRGTAHRTLYDGTIYSYGLSVFGPALWYIGLPAGSSRNEVAFEFELVDPEDRVVWSYRTEGSHKVVQGLFYNWGNDALHFATLMEQGMNEALRDLEGRLPELRTRASAGGS